jgi:hypothetical protein
MSTLATTLTDVVLWALEIFSLLVVAAGVFILMIDPASWLLALASIAFFGLCALAFARMLMLRKQQIP